MRFILYSNDTQLSCEGEFPANEIGIDSICSQLKLKNTAETQVTINAVNFLNCEMEEEIFQDKTFVLDELNLLSKQLALLTQNEIEIFSVTATENNFSTRELIDLTMNVHNMELIKNQPDVIMVATKLALEKDSTLKAEDVKFSQEEASRFLCDFSKGQESQLTEDGRLLYKSDDWEPFYTGKCLPETNYDQSPISVDLLVRGRGQGNNCETLQLPYFQPTLDKALERLGVTDESQEVGINLSNCDVSPRLKDFITDVNLTLKELPYLNSIAYFLDDMAHNRGTDLMKMVDVTNMTTLEELGLVAKNFDDLEIYYDIESANEYGEYLLEESCDSDFSWQLNEFMDFDAFGEKQLEDILHVFTEDGLLTYSGNNSQMIEEIKKMQAQTQGMGGMYQ